MKVSTVSIVMAILCTLSSSRSADSDDTIAIAANNSTAIAVNCRPLDPACSNAPGSSSGSNDKDKESTWRDALEKALRDKYEREKRGDLDRAIKALVSSIQNALSKSGLSEAIKAQLNLALELLMKAILSDEVSFKESCYNKAFSILIIIVSGGEKSDKIEETTMSYAEWKAGMERELDEKFDRLKNNDADRDISALMKGIQKNLPLLCPPRAAELNYAMNILVKAIGSNDSGIKRASYNEALDIYTRVMAG
ncbi:uncharacterized protein LOC105233798 [Bactrocera dorsalis]|uniref:Uncharacterized protein LOC105233798 n=1 Tax=Bactrocera dorsalis TaxID=27457 RepID=A0ABM3J2C9_BACDO|nr:uncharacterized protein LOC105233798 [Bactrocera dorsalis]